VIIIVYVFRRISANSRLACATVSSVLATPTSVVEEFRLRSRSKAELFYPTYLYVK